MSSAKRAILAILAMVLTISTLIWLHRSAQPRKVTWQIVEQEAARGGYALIDSQGLATLIQKEGQSALLVDTRQAWEFRAGHIKGAVNFPMEPTWWARWSKKDQLARFLGPDKDKPLVFY